jgi:tagatose 6-phosphate kinase
MILIVTLNPALDVTYHAGRVDWDGVNRPHRVTGQPGGKGVNVARTLRALGTEVLVTGLAGGATGESIRRGLREAGIACELTGIAGETRRTVAVVDAARGTTALFNEPGPGIDPAEWEAFRVLYEQSLGRCRAVVLTGSLPPGVPDDGYALLAARAAAAGLPVLLDAGGTALRAGVAAGPAIAKPNLAELGAALGRPVPLRAGAVCQAAGDLMTAGARAVVVSLGDAGLIAVTGEGCWRARAPRRDSGNPTGAGDAVAAGLAQGLACDRSWPERLRQAAALGAATAAAPVAGVFSRAAYRAALAGVRIEPIEREAAEGTLGPLRPAGPGRAR